MNFLLKRIEILFLVCLLLFKFNSYCQLLPDLEDLVARFFRDAFKEVKKEVFSNETSRNRRDLSSNGINETGSNRQNVTSMMELVQKATPESKEIHDKFLIALKAHMELLNNNQTIHSNKTHLRAPPSFCPFQSEISCDPTSKYRQIDGSCNNLLNGLLGKSLTPYKRLLTPAYDDRINEPRKTAVSGDPLPNPREISLAIHEPMDTPAKISNFGVMFGQFIDHDFALSASTSGPDGSALKCNCDSSNPDCINIPTPENDVFDTDQSCMTLTRSGASFDKFDCALNARTQLNLLTHWLDMSQIYGTDTTQENNLRSFTRGRLKSSTISGFKGDYLPKASPGGCVDEFDDETCFESGDSRTSQNMLLVSIHTIWLREHNRIAKELRRFNPTWSDESLFQEARRINIAEYQHVIFSEWLPIIIGKNLMNKFGLNVQAEGFFMGYDSDVNPQLSSEFSTAAFRFGHTLVRSFLSKMNSNLVEIANLTLSDIMLRPVEAYRNGGLDSICRGMLMNPGTSFDNHITNEIQNHLFESNGGETHRFSLSAINIMRGRDHGIPPYNKFRKLVGLREASNFNDFKEIPNSALRGLQNVYQSVDDVDAFTGGVSERPLSDAILGPTFANVVGMQFRDLKFGDRFYYENGQDRFTRFTPDQLDEIRKTSMARILCDNLVLKVVTIDAFLPGERKRLVKCSKLKKLDLGKWKNEPLIIEDTEDQIITSTTIQPSEEQFVPF